jgi:hypothetical protein
MGLGVVVEMYWVRGWALEAVLALADNSNAIARVCFGRSLLP